MDCYVQGLTNEAGIAVLDISRTVDAVDVIVRPGAPDPDVEPIVVEGVSGGDVEVRMESRWHLKGVVRMDDGSRFDGVVYWWTAHPSDGVRHPARRGIGTDSKGRFLLPWLRRGRVCVEAIPGKRYSLLHLVDRGMAEGDLHGFEPGAKDVVIRVRPGETLEAGVGNWRSGMDTHRVRIICQSDGKGFGAVVREGGVIRVYDLGRGHRYTVWVGPVGDGLCAVQRDVEAGGAPVLLSLAHGLEIRGTVVGDSRTEARGVTIERPDLGFGPETDERGRFVIRGVVPGVYTLRGFGVRDGTIPVSACVQVRAGEMDVIVDLRGKEERKRGK